MYVCFSFSFSFSFSHSLILSLSLSLSLSQPYQRNYADGQRPVPEATTTAAVAHHALVFPHSENNKNNIERRICKTRNKPPAHKTTTSSSSTLSVIMVNRCAGVVFIVLTQVWQACSVASANASLVSFYPSIIIMEQITKKINKIKPR